ncbi:hypothetical protein [Streptomyces sp. cmx-4-9]|uniref:hypothetical protein n=1 Tax=Streptomyces sp. cmx-4-9 TaxID=2790941 RepID=UPI0039811004
MSATDANPRWIALAGIVGALIGAVGGFAGTVGGFFQAADSRKIAQEQRQADIRRKSYVELATQFQSLKIKGNTLRNYIFAAVKPISQEVTQKYKDDSWAKAGELFNSDFIPAVDRSFQMVVTVDLVATDAARRKVKNFEKGRDLMVALLRDTMLNAKPLDFVAFDKTVRACEVALDGFLVAVRDEVL